MPTRLPNFGRVRRIRIVMGELFSWVKRANPGRVIAHLSAISFSASLCADVVSWRNNGQGKYPEATPPLNWEEHIVWEIPLENTSNGSPILIGNKLFLCQEPSTLVCVNSQSGKVLWKRDNDLTDLLGYTEDEKAHVQRLQARVNELRPELNRVHNDWRRLKSRLEKDGDNESLQESFRIKGEEGKKLHAQRQELVSDPKYDAVAPVPTHGTNGYTSFTPVSDGQRVYVAFGHGTLAAYDLEGNRIWGKRMEQPNVTNSPGGTSRWGGSTSPILVDGKLIVHFADYTALNPETGEELWRIPSEAEYGTPAVFEVEGQFFIFTPRGEVIRTKDGKTIDSGLVQLHHTYAWTAFSTPVVENGVVYTVRGLAYDGPDGHAHAYRIPKDLDTLQSQGLEPLWHTEVHKNRYYASPVIHNGLMYIFSQDFVFSVLRADTGEIVYGHNVEGLKGTAYTSISLAGDTLFFGSDDGILIAAQPGREYKELARSRLDIFRSSPIFEGNTAYLRAYSNLYAISSDR